MNVLIADDHLVVREGLKGILLVSHPGSVVEEAADGHEALTMIEKKAYDLVILDIAMPRLNGIDVLESIRRNNKKTHILILSMYPQAHYAVHAFRLGASGYLTKGCAYGELASAIEKISAGGRYVSSDIAEAFVFDQKGSDRRLPHEKLSEREFQVFLMLGRGKTPTEIAADIKLSVKTVSTHRSRILHKMQLKKNLDLSLYAIHHGLLE